MEKTSKYIYAVGRRKTATARIRLFLKKGDLIINKQPIDKYFPSSIDKTAYLTPFKLVGKANQFSATIKVKGSGKKAQLGAVIHGLARAISKHDPDSYRTTLKRAGLLTRDPRAKERHKVGTGGKARRKKQSPKR